LPLQIGHTDRQSQQVERNMAAFCKPELNFLFYEEGSREMAKENNIPSHIHTELALLELNSAISMLRLMAESEITTSEFRDCFPVLLNELNNATYYLGNLKNPSPPNGNVLTNGE
jgi:hypothetical protein